MNALLARTRNQTLIQSQSHSQSQAHLAPAERPLPARLRAVLDFPFAPPAADGSVIEVAPGLLWARMPMPMALDHINVYLLRSASGWTVIDTGLNTDLARSCWERIVSEHLEGLPIEALICTHFHYDHAGLAQWMVERFGVPLYMTMGEFMTMRVMNTPLSDPLPPSLTTFYAAAGLSHERTLQMFNQLRQDPFIPPPSPAYRRLRGGQVLSIGAREWRIIIGEGHSPEHACLYCEADGLLIAGDQLLPGISSNIMITDIEPDANPLQCWFDSLDRLEVCRADTLVLPSHQKVFRGLHARTQELREHHLQQFAILLQHLEQSPSCTAVEAMKIMFPKLRGAIDDMLALGETLAHLSWLCKSDWLQRTRSTVPDADGCMAWQYSRVLGARDEDIKEERTHW